MQQSRREFVKTSATTVACATALFESRKAQAKPLHLPLGLQLYSVRDQLPKDFDGTLKDLGALGYKEVESAGYYNHSAAEVRDGLEKAGLKLVSAHVGYDALHQHLDEIIDFHKQLGVTYIICSYPGKNPNPSKSAGTDKANPFTLDDWQWNAGQFNLFGEKVSAAGMKFGYHNHQLEFHATNGVSPYDELMRLTDPAKVTMELDCGWVFVGGGNILELLRKYPKRITMLHVKDFKASGPIGEGSEPKIAELGRGSIDYAPIFAEAAKNGNIAHCFVEQEAFTVPPMESLKIDADYMRKLGAA